LLRLTPHTKDRLLFPVALGRPGTAGARHRRGMPARPRCRGALRHGVTARRDGVPLDPGRGDRRRARRAVPRWTAPRRPGQPSGGPGSGGAGARAGCGALLDRDTAENVGTVA